MFPERLHLNWWTQKSRWLCATWVGLNHLSESLNERKKVQIKVNPLSFCLTEVRHQSCASLAPLALQFLALICQIFWISSLFVAHLKTSQSMNHVSQFHAYTYVCVYLCICIIHVCVLQISMCVCFCWVLFSRKSWLIQVELNSGMLSLYLRTFTIHHINRIKKKTTWSSHRCKKSFEEA
jgi:hypothetical protein